MPRPAKAKRPTPLPPDAAPTLSPAELLAELRRHGGREYRATLTFGGTDPGREKGEYRLTARGKRLRVQGPAGRTSELDQAGFFQVFAHYRFADPQPTGVLTDLGPLFG